MTIQAINPKELLEKAKNSKDKETYIPLYKTPTYRIGAGVRAKPNSPTFFIEIIVNLSDKTKKVNLDKLEKTSRCLKLLQARKYTLTYEYDNSIVCEKTNESQKLNEGYQFARLLLEQL